jgi:sugar/nucleoside kinase (ribokinase family)
MRTPEVLVIGDANPDLVLGGDVEPQFGQVEKLVDSAELVLGGSGAIVAAGLARLGVPTALAATVGDDLFGRFVRDELAASGVDASWIRTDPLLASPVTVVLSAKDRAILTYPGTLGSTGPDVVDADLLTRVRHVHSASMFLLPALAPHLPDVFRRARAAGATCSVDTNWDPSERWSGVLPLLQHTDVLMPNTAELLAITGMPDLDRAARGVVELGCAVALKNGKDGGILWADQETITVPAPPVEAVDNTGAGDSFDAGFISAMLDGLAVRQRLERAVFCGSLSTRGFGGTAAQATRADLSAKA